ncbi:NAD(P)H-hydrate dehydratase [Nonomuraea sp. NBC_01738]|uniref:NAD(P)H-hydrate dehydratase n=1 Tax=Nonomuraea sp. NBC_01738 TaxID=2976003 RepID=UPI002E0EB1B9|nr:NAD(P)H-hydrate dehydratase [Nonomuraea sp. NBC_01738]
MRVGYSGDQVRAAEGLLMRTLPHGTLMQRAAAGLAATCAELLGRVYGARVVLLVGSGDNGGDALFAGARLARRGARVSAVLAGSRAHEEGLAAFRAAGGRTADPTELDQADLVVDGLVGIGATGPLREPYASLAAMTGDALVVAVDVPSGVDAATGRVDGTAVKADVTVTMGTPKAGLFIDPAAAYTGTLVLVDIGLAPYLPEPEVTVLADADVRELLPRPGAESDKYRRGVVGIAAGSDAYTGAAVLAVGGALRAGAGMVRYAGTAAPVAQVRAAWPEAVITELSQPSIEDVGRVQAWMLGPGLGTGAFARDLVAAVLAGDAPVVVDADALTVVAQDPGLLRREAPVVITPHAGELSRLVGVPRQDIEAARLDHVRQAATELGVTVLLKGSTTLVAREGAPTRVNPTGTSWLAAAGTGDVLSGVTGALLAQGLDCYDAASCAAYLHGRAGTLAADGAPLVSAEVATAIPGAIRSLSR